jgi:hypothetical protein
MLRFNWTQSIVPDGNDQTVYLVADDSGKPGSAWVETDYETTNLETVIQDLLTGQYSNPIRVIAFNTAERWSEDVSEDVAHELRQRCDLQMRDVATKGAIATSSCLPLPMRLCSGPFPIIRLWWVASLRRKYAAVPRLHATRPRGACGDVRSSLRESPYTGDSDTSARQRPRCLAHVDSGSRVQRRRVAVDDDAWPVACWRA